MPSEFDIVEGLREQYRTDARMIQEINAKLNELRPKFQQYNDLSAQLTSLEDRARINFLMLSPFTDWQNDNIEPPPEVLGLALQGDAEVEKKKISLWRVIREITRQSVKIRIVQLQKVLTAIGYKVSRQAIESALATHKKTFRVSRNGRETFVSLKQ